MNLQLMVDDPRFINMGLQLGYTKQELSEISMEAIEQQSLPILKGMSQIQQGFYLKKKYQALQARQAKIYKHINEELKKQNHKKPRRSFQAVTTKMLIDHQHALDKKERFQKIRQLHTREKMKYNTNKTIDLGRTSPNFSNISYQSRISRKTINSASSNRSRLSTTSHKERLNLVRQKQKDIQSMKKIQYERNQSKSRQRMERVKQSRQSLSRKLKTKSEINKQAVNEKKQQITSIRDKEIRQHIQQTQYKMLKNEHIRQKQLEKRRQNSLKQDALYKKQLKNMFEQNQKKQNQRKYQSKIRNVTLKKYEMEIKRAETMQLKRRQQQSRHQRVHRYRQYIQEQRQQDRNRTLFYENQSLERARKLKNEIQSEKKMKILQSRVKQQITKNNYITIERRRKLQTQEKAMKMNQRVRQLNQFEEFKKSLEKEKKTYKYSRNLQKRDRFSFY